MLPSYALGVHKAHMPMAAPKQCATRGCRKRATKGRTCVDCTPVERGTASERGYGARWQKARLMYLRAHPLCATCEKAGRVTAARVVDHIRPHRGDETLFWDEANWQALCDHRSPYNCHGAKTGKGL